MGAAARLPSQLLTDWARQGALQLCRWLPGRQIIFVGDSSFAAHELAHAITPRADLISRLRPDASLYASPEKRTPRTMGQASTKRARIAPAQDLARENRHRRVQDRRLGLVWSNPQQRARHRLQHGLWYRLGTPVLPIRWVLCVFR
jgi:hypothetical protein